MELQSGTKLAAHVGFLGTIHLYSGSKHVNTFTATILSS